VHAGARASGDVPRTDATRARSAAATARARLPAVGRANIVRLCIKLGLLCFCSSDFHVRVRAKDQSCGWVLLRASARARSGQMAAATALEQPLLGALAPPCGECPVAIAVAGGAPLPRGVGGVRGPPSQIRVGEVPKTQHQTPGGKVKGLRLWRLVWQNGRRSKSLKPQPAWSCGTPPVCGSIRLGRPLSAAEHALAVSRPHRPLVELGAKGAQN
jgi:hypothetical protein